MKSICLVTDPLVTTMGAVRPALLLAKEFCKSGYQVTLATPRFLPEIRNAAQAENIGLQRVGLGFSLISSFPTLDAWARSLAKQRATNDLLEYDSVINTSSCIITKADAYYAQGPMTRTLDDISCELPLHYRMAYQSLRLPLKVLEKGLIGKFRVASKLLVANSAFCSSMYEELGIRVDAIINPPLDCQSYKPTTSKPTANYVLTHLGTYGKEGKFSVIKAIADAGVSVRIFGETSFAPLPLIRHPNVIVLGRISERKLAEAYSNALFTLFPFSHEPFGYIPIESAACGTPVLTYGKQGPSETMIDGKTGWLAGTDQELIVRSVLLWKEGYDTRVRANCRERALSYDTRVVFEKWKRALKLF